jgi:hypothetical protein
MRKANAALPLLVLGALFLIAEVLPTHAFNNAILSTAHLLDGGGSQYPVVAAGNVLDGGDVSSLSSTQILRYETPALLRGWAQHPIQGAGFGAILPGYARNVEKPWGFEAQYPLLLFQTGLIGLALLAIIARWGWRFLRRAALKTSDHGLATVLVVTTTAVICVLVANAADPYLQAPGVCWGMYLPFAAANLALTARNPHPPTEIPVDFGGSSR